MKKYALLIALCAVAAALVIVWGVSDPTPDNGAAPEKIALVLTEDTGTYIMKLKSGAQDAATGRGAELSVFVARDALPQQVISGGYWAVILTADTGIPLDAARTALGGTRLVLIGGEGGDCAVLSDPFSEGRGAVAALAVPAGGTVVLLADGGDWADSDGLADGNGAANSSALPDVNSAGRLSGALDALASMDCNTVTLPANDAAWAQIASLSPAALIAVSDTATTAAIGAKLSGLLDASLPLSGFAGGDAIAEPLETGLADALTAPVPYAMGYQAVSAAFTGKGALIPGRAITLETLFDSENASIAFPLLQ